MKKRIGMIILVCTCAVAARAQDIDDLLHTVDSLSAQPGKAVEILNRALADHPDSEELLKVRAEGYENLKQYSNAVADYTRLAQMNPDEEIFWYLLGRNQFKNGQLQDALKSLHHATRLNPKYLPAYHIKIQVLLQLNQDEAALKVSDTTLNIGATTMNYFWLGEVYRKMKSWQRANWAYESAAKIDKGFIDAYIALADIAANTNKANETLEAAESALGVNPDSKEALIARSRGFALYKNYADAIDDVSYVIKTDSRNVSAYYWRGTYYRDSNKMQEALKDFDQTLKLQPDHWQALAGRADVLAKMGNKKAALESYQKLLTIAANHPEKETITQLANQRIFELNREDRAPTLVLTDPEPEGFNLQIPANLSSITIKGVIFDESPIKTLIINGQKIPVIAIGKDFEFATAVSLEKISEIQIEASDVYDNVAKLAYHVTKTETGKPQIELLIPKPSATGTITLSDGGTTLYIEGKITDESAIASILVDGKAMDFDQETMNPAFSTLLDINQKTRFSIIATDLYGNTSEQIYTIQIIEQ